MSGTFDGNQLRGRRNQLDRGLQLRDRAKGVACTADEENGSPQAGEMRGPQLFWPSWRMQRIRQQEQPIDQSRLGGNQHAGLTSSIGNAAEKGPSCKLLLHELDGPPQSGLIMLGIGRGRRPMRTPLAIGEVTTKGVQPGGGELFRQRNQQRRIAIAARAVGEDKEAGA